MLQCRFCLGEVYAEEADEEGVIVCECGAQMYATDALFSSGVDWIEDSEDEEV